MRLLKRLVAKLAWPFLRHQMDFNHLVLAEIAALRGEIASTPTGGGESLGTAQHLARIDNDLEHLTSVLIRHEVPLKRFEEAFAEHNVLIAGLQRGLSDAADKLQRQAFARYEEERSAMRRDMAELLREFDDLRGLLALSDRSVAEAQMRLARIELFFAEYRRAHDTGGAAAADAIAPPATFEGLYGALENAFRGSPALIRSRLMTYVDDVVESSRLGGPVLDLGCGRGEWLEVLKGAGVDAYGVDSNTSYTEDWKELGVHVVIDDLLAHLRRLEPASLSAVTAFQVVEHLPLEVLIEMLDLSARALRPGGLLLLETPNPDNLIVGASTFYLDPTHQRPIPSLLLEFLVGARGFVDIEVKLQNRPEMSPLPVPMAKDVAWVRDFLPLFTTVNERFFGAQDYAVVAHRI
jgi:O-antigen chain-terminating methyltransferase